MLPSRANARSQRIFYQFEGMNRRAIRFLDRAFLTSSRTSRAIRVLECEPRVLPTVAFASVFNVIIKTRIYDRIPFLIAQLRREDNQVVGVPMILDAFMRFVNSLFLTRLLYRYYGAVVVVDVFRYLKWQPILPFLKVTMN